MIRPLQHRTRQRVRPGGKQRPVGGLEAEALIVEVTLQHGDLMAEDEAASLRSHHDRSG
jgi:hypothetical protein